LKEIIPLDDNNIPKGLTPLKISFSTSDVNNNKDPKQEDSKRKIGNIIYVCWLCVILFARLELVSTLCWARRGVRGKRNPSFLRGS
jgi:hypothetical protein